MSDEEPKTARMEDEEHALFGVVKMYVWAAGGDGDGWIMSQRWRELADKFEAWEKADPDPWFTQRVNHEHQVIFYHGQETMGFVPLGTPANEWQGDIVVQVY